MSMSPEMDARLRAAAEAEELARQRVLALVDEAHADGGTLREIGAAIGRSHTQVGRMVDARRIDREQANS